MSPLNSDVRMLIAVRVVVITSLLLAVLLVQYSASNILPSIDFLYLTTGLTYALTLVYIAVGRLLRSRKINLYIQISGDLLVETILVYFTGGLDSPFSFLYLVSIITASMLLFRRGGLLTASGAVILYGGVADLMFYNIIPRPRQNVFVSDWTSFRLYVNMATNFAGFYATAFLTSYISEKLRATFEELDLNKQSLARLQSLNQNVIMSIPSGLLTLNADGAVSFANPPAGEILGVRPDLLIGTHVTTTGIFDSEAWLRLREVVRTSNLARGEEFDFMRGEEPRCIGWALTLLQSIGGDPSGYTLIFQDLTEMKTLEEQVRFKDRMAAVGELSAGIAHEIRNPLAAIAGSVQVLRNSESLTPQEKRLMSIILKESDRLNNSIADFLRFVRPQERQSVDFDIAVSLSETLELLSNSAELSAEHKIEKLIEPASFFTRGDPNQIRQVFWNIAINAIKAMPGGGSLRVIATPDGDSYKIFFRDDGKGMSDRAQRALFQPFRTSFPSGTGLGMAISYRIIQEHGGSIAAESQPGIGTSITISLPIPRPRVLAGPGASPAGSQ